MPLPNNAAVSGDNYKHAAGFVFFPVTSNWRKYFSEIFSVSQACPLIAAAGEKIIAVPMGGEVTESQPISHASLSHHTTSCGDQHTDPHPGSWKKSQVFFDFSLKSKVCKQGGVAGVWVSDYIGKSDPSGFETGSVLKQ